MAKPKSKTGKPSTKTSGANPKKGGNFKTKGKGGSGPKKQFKKKPITFKEGEKKPAKDEVNDKKRKLAPEEFEELKKKKKHGSETVAKFMTIYEKLRRKDTVAGDRIKLIDEVIVIAEGKEKEIVFKHSTVRVLEMCVKYGKEEQKEKIFKIFKDNLVTLLTSKYAKFLVEKFIEYGTKDQRKKIVETFYGKVKKLIKHKDAASILEEIYCKYANASQRAALVEEFYGPEFAVFKVASGRTLEDILENDPEKKQTIMKHMKESLSLLCQKDVLSLSVIHRALVDFFKYAENQQKIEMMEVLKQSLVHILHTKDGSKAAMNCLWLASTKDRKLISKSFKTFVVKICKEEFGHRVLFALFDTMDDTVLLKKVIFPEILSNLEDLLVNQYGRKVLLYILKPRHSSCFLPEVIKVLEQGDGNPYSKKPAPTRQQELRDILLPDLLKCLTKNIKDIILNKSTAVVLLATLEVAKESGQTLELMEKIAGVFGKPLKNKGNDLQDEDDEDEEDEDKPSSDHPIMDACGHWLVKNIIKQDKVKVENGNENIFSSLLCEHVPSGCFSDWSTENRGAFVLVSLLETKIESVVERVKEDLKFHEKSKKKSKESNNKGQELLSKLLLEK